MAGLNYRVGQENQPSDRAVLGGTRAVYRSIRMARMLPMTFLLQGYHEIRCSCGERRELWAKLGRFRGRSTAQSLDVEAW